MVIEDERTDGIPARPDRLHWHRLRLSGGPSHRSRAQGLAEAVAPDRMDTPHGAVLRGCGVSPSAGLRRCCGAGALRGGVLRGGLEYITRKTAGRPHAYDISGRALNSRERIG